MDTQDAMTATITKPMAKTEEDVEPPRPATGRILLLVVLLALFALAAYSRRDEAIKVWNTLRHGEPYLLVVAMVVQVTYWLTFAAMYKASYAVVGVKSRIRDLLPVWLASLFVNIAAPAAAPAVFLDDAARRGQSPAKAAAGMLVLRLTDFGTLILFVVAGLAVLASRHALHTIHVVALFGLIGVTLAWTGPLFLAEWKPSALLAALKSVRTVTNSLMRLIGRPELLDADWPEHHAAQFDESADAVFADPKRLLVPAGVAIVAHVLDMLSLHVLLSAFGIGPDILASLATFAICLLFWIVSPSPDGIGFVEPAVAHALTKLHVASFPAAFAAALAFRGITLYLPVLIGAFCLPRLAAAVRKDTVR